MAEWPITIYDQGGLYADQHHYGFEETYGSTPVPVIPADFGRELYEGIQRQLSGSEHSGVDYGLQEALARYEREVGTQIGTQADEEGESRA